MSESELHAILNEIKNKGQVPDNADIVDDKQDYEKIIESFNPVTKEDALDAFSARREKHEEATKKEKVSFLDKLKNIFKK